MFRTVAMVSMAVMCILPGTLMGAALAVEAGQGRAPAIASQHAAAPVEARSLDLGCIGYHGSGSGYVANGRCVTG